MESEVVWVNGGVPNEGIADLHGNGLELQVNGLNGYEHVGVCDMGKGTLADEVLEDLEEYWEDISDHLMISRMVSDSVIKGMVSAVEQEAAEKIRTKELEVANLKECLLSHAVDTGAFEPVMLPSPGKVDEVKTIGKFVSFTASCMKHDKMRGDLHSVRNAAIEQFNYAKKEIEHARQCNSIEKAGSGSDLVGLGGILLEKQSDSLLHVDKMLENLKSTVNKSCTKMDDILISSKFSLCQWQQEREISSELEDMVMQSAIRSLKEEFQKLWDQETQLHGVDDVNWLEKFNDISSIRSQLDAIFKSLSISEQGLISHGSHDLEHLHHKAFNNHVPLPTSLCEESGKIEFSNTDVPESYDFQQLKHMPREELEIFFNNIITKLRRDHESALHQMTEKYFSLKRDYLKEKGSFATQKRDEEFNVLKKKIREVIAKLEDFLVENERFPVLTNNVERLGKLQDRLEHFLSENRHLKDCLADKENEVKRLEAQVCDAAGKLMQNSLAEEKRLRRVLDLKAAAEDSCIEASVSEDVFKCALRHLIGQKGCFSEDSDILLRQEICDVILSAAVPAGTRDVYEINDSEIESLTIQGLSGLVFSEAVKDAKRKLDDLHQEILNEKENRTAIESEALKKEKELRLEENERLKQELLVMETTLDQTEKLAMDLSLSLSQERENCKIASEELNCLKETLSQQQSLVTESKNQFESSRAHLVEALEQIESYEMEFSKLNQELDQTKQELTETIKERSIALVLAHERLEKLLSTETREEESKRKMQMAVDCIHGLYKMFDDFHFRISGAIQLNNRRLEGIFSHLTALNKLADILKRIEPMYKQRLERKCADLCMAEAEVDLLGDEVDVLLRLLEKIYIALDHYSPILKHYPGIIEILELVRRELFGDPTKRNELQGKVE